MRSKFSQGMSHSCTAAWWGWLGENRGPVLAWHNLGSARPFPKSFREDSYVSGGMSGWGAGTSSCPSRCSGAAPPGSGTAEAMGVTRARHSISTKARGLVPSTAALLALALSHSSQPGLGLFWAPALAFEFQPCCLQERAVCEATAALGAGGTRPLHSGCATLPVPLQTRCFISSRCTRSAPATSPQRETPPPPGTRRWGLPGLGKSPSDVQ